MALRVICRIGIFFFPRVDLPLSRGLLGRKTVAITFSELPCRYIKINAKKRKKNPRDPGNTRKSYGYFVAYRSPAYAAFRAERRWKSRGPSDVLRSSPFIIIGPLPALFSFLAKPKKKSAKTVYILFIVTWLVFPPVDTYRKSIFKTAGFSSLPVSDRSPRIRDNERHFFTHRFIKIKIVINNQLFKNSLFPPNGTIIILFCNETDRYLLSWPSIIFYRNFVLIVRCDQSVHTESITKYTWK